MQFLQLMLRRGQCLKCLELNNDLVDAFSLDEGSVSPNALIRPSRQLHRACRRWLTGVRPFLGFKITETPPLNQTQFKRFVFNIQMVTQYNQQK